MAEVKDILKSEGWGKAEGWRAFHYFVAQTFAPGLAVALCSESQISMEVPADGFWPVPPRSIGGSDDGDGFGACDICRLASGARPWAKDEAGAALKQMLWALTEALGKEARMNVAMNLGGQITPEVVCDALGQLQRQATSLHTKWARAERVLAVYELAKEGLAFLIESDAEPSDTFAAGVVDALLKSKGVRL